MPTLQFKGKNIIWNHHLSIPYHTLDEVDKFHFQSDKVDGNLIIEGDNLLALKALLPQYSGKIKCIYIDPPYNTGNDNGQGKGWIYNDNVNTPLLINWFKVEVNKDDLTRHDKWLCMMVPRLKLLRELLSDDGIIFINIDDKEFHNLKMVMDEIFGEDNYKGTIIRGTGQTTGQDSGGLGLSYDYILLYSKNSDTELAGLPLSDDDLERYEEEDNRGKYALWQLRKTGSNDRRQDRPNMFYPIKNPDDQDVYPIGPTGYDSCWRFEKKAYYRLSEENYIVWKKRKNNGEEEWWPYVKTYLEGKTKRPSPLWTDLEGSKKASTDLSSLLGEKKFNYPKPIQLIKRICQIIPDNKDMVILDSFAGSGTTMHAVMDLNKEDGGNRKCILIQMTEATDAEPKKNICKDITRERVKRAIEKYGYDSGFQYYKVGIPIDAETLLSGNLPTYKQFAEYVYYLCTGESLKDKKSINEKSFFVGDTGNSVIYLVYKQSFDELTRMALNLTLAEKITAEHPKKRVVVYAPACFLEEDYMTEKGIDYVGIPYNLFQRSEV